ncbi:atp4 subunit B of the stator stalk of mitochondrial F1F0 ATP synthase [Elasticomyces elasticus]|nr:atp4 subunit B of the stator stalk of mitochondrial F1F0 ATP synthase [Elasticomyces elasticus]KAK3662874.1 atp4 subunit B of the stator stalk of mitochondrial F1F0 ATP synthase [Elasticomyces elasticus]KAK4930069.1 atp4 subunit B of the stator stalk of mitochondrial F1F0 ATP synthase [Elasticomyces elasticus]KAK5763549.1 atp4 subunit B of the stator stalk of mitochondrial F1F0 ATP synthase [Elasticomyces elasticus]
MASLVAKRAMGALRTTARPTLLRPAATTFSTTTAFRADTPSPPSVPAKNPKDTAQSILNALPGNSLVSKTAILSATAGLSIAAISNEIYVVNEESIVMLSLLTIYWAVYNYAGPMYKDWADSTAAKYAGILNAARRDHTEAVKTRIESVKSLGGVIDITKDLFAVSKETAQLEAQAYELEQRTAVAAEARNVLDSWVRYEGQVKARQQKELAESIIAKIAKELENPKVLDQILKQSVADVERIVSQKA